MTELKKETQLLNEEVETVEDVVDVVETVDSVPEAVIKADEYYEEEVSEPEKVIKAKNIELNFGIKSRDLLDEEEETLKEKAYKELQKHKRNNSLLWVRVDGVEINPKTNMVVAVARWNDMRIAIPDRNYFMPTFNFGEDYETLSEKEKARTRYRMLSYQIGAVVGILIDELTAELRSDGKMEYGIIGNRVQAMNLLQFYYFTRSNLQEDEVIHVGDAVKAKVLSVHPLFAIVECLGVETRVDTFNISNGNVRDCREVVSVGDEITVRIRKLHLPEKPNANDAQVYLTVSGRVKLVENIKDKIKPNCIYQGVVTKYNPVKNIYTVTLTDGINVSCYKQNNAYEVYRVGDKVTTLINFITNDYATGSILKKISTH